MSILTTYNNVLAIAVTDLHLKGTIFLLPMSFLLLISIMPGTKKLAIAKTSQSFCWNAPEVISLCSQGCLYVLAKINPIEKINECEEVQHLIKSCQI